MSQMQIEETSRADVLRRYAIINTPPEPNFDRITRMAAGIFGFPFCALAFVDGDRFWFKSTQGLQATEMWRDRAFCQETIRRQTVFVVPDALADPQFSNAPVVSAAPHVRFYAGAPLITPSGTCIGSLCVLDTQRQDGLSADRQFILTDLAATVVELLEARARQIALVATTQEIAYLATHDPLTGLPNRRHLTDLVGTMKAGEAIAALYLDLDGFKSVNDRFGHAIGDALLQQVAARLRQVLPPDATAARLGGDEFAVILGGPDLMKKAAIVAQGVIAMLGQTYHVEGCEADIGVSIGIALADDPDRLNTSLRLSDIALYSAKSQGRGCYRFAHDAAAAIRKTA
ncbi:sensor domain-containing diguanylate cyclase [Metarhizobium album]|uniref:Sensor domain-containing diguanylate cyclase n=2 Tax=Metarhizobium album TaxID=2182425 RepID=A0A2U2DN19_9HYPH|nr:sensor domain-containing diguanylate cyclase [Rhizobium album]